MHRVVHQLGDGGVLRGNLRHQQEDSAALFFIRTFQRGIEAVACIAVFPAHHIAHPTDAFQGRAGRRLEFYPSLVHRLRIFVCTQINRHIHGALGYFGIARAVEHGHVGGQCQAGIAFMQCQLRSQQGKGIVGAVYDVFPTLMLVCLLIAAEVAACFDFFAFNLFLGWNIVFILGIQRGGAQQHQGAYDGF